MEQQPTGPSGAPSPQPQTPLNQQPSNTVTSGQAGGQEFITGNQLPESYSKPARNNNKMMVRLSAAAVLLIVVLVVLILTNIIALSRFKTINYSNGEGASFKLKFYSKHTLKNTFQSQQPTSGANPNLKELVSKVSIDDKYPLTMFISGSPGASQLSGNGKQAALDNDCTKNGLTKAFEVKMSSINDNVAVCSITSNGILIFYIATFRSSDNLYVATVSQDVNWSTVLSNSSSAKQGLDKIGLDTYQDDVTTILSSIQPVN